MQYVFGLFEYSQLYENVFLIIKLFDTANENSKNLKVILRNCIYYLNFCVLCSSIQTFFYGNLY